MHEMAITQDMLAIVLDEAAKTNARKVSAINVVLGEMTGVVDECVQTWFDMLSRGTMAEGATLSFRKVPRSVRCRTCGHTFTPSDINWACPECKSLGIEVIAGTELYVESLEVE